MTMNRQQRRAQARAGTRIRINTDALRQSHPLVEATYQQGYAEGCHAALHAGMKMYFAAAVIALHELEGYGAKRNVRFLRLMQDNMTNALTSEEIIDEAIKKAGVKLTFDEPFVDDMIQEEET